MLTGFLLIEQEVAGLDDYGHLLPLQDIGIKLSSVPADSIGKFACKRCGYSHSCHSLQRNMLVR